VSFFNTSVEQLQDEERQQIQNMAISTRGAKVEDFDKFLKSFDKKIEKNTEVSHKANMAMLNKKL